jgi:aminoglycoside/choline kinase family phosphotransferase
MAAVATVVDTAAMAGTVASGASSARRVAAAKARLFMGGMGVWEGWGLVAWVSGRTALVWCVRCVQCVQCARCVQRVRRSGARARGLASGGQSSRRSLEFNYPRPGQPTQRAPPLSAHPLWPDNARKARFDAWLSSIQAAHGLHIDTLQSASADASFRRYLRLQSAKGTLVVMDAPPPQEDVRPFVRVADLLHGAGLCVPQVLQADAANGFLLLTDLGNQLFLAALQQAQADNNSTVPQQLMLSALQALVQLQTGVPASALPAFDEHLLRSELELFPAWCVQKECGLTWSAAEQTVWQRCSQLLVDSALQQPKVAVHADWMPRNLMLPLPGSQRIGVLDFQDAVAGPITYDTASSLHALVQSVLAANAKSVEEFRAGKEKAFNALVGQVMKASQGKANPAQAADLLRSALGAGPTAL